MKKWIFFCIFVIQTAYAQWEWSKPIPIFRGISPDLDIDNKTGQLHILSMFTGAIYTKTDSVGNILSQETVPGSGYDSGGWTFGASIAVDRNGFPHVCYRVPNAYYFSTYYIFKTGSGWSNALGLATDIYRGYMVRLAVDGSNRVHLVRSNPSSDNAGNFVYYRIVNGKIDRGIGLDVDYRPDLRLEIDATSVNFIHILTGCPKYPHGSVQYYRSEDGGNNFTSYGDIHASSCLGNNESVDVYADKVGNVHICYGTQIDTDVGSKPSIRYVRYKDKNMVRHVPATKPGDLDIWGENGWGICSIAASDSGEYVMIAYMKKDVGDLYTILSADGGATWNDPVKIAGSIDSRPNGRARHVLRAYRNHFYLLYSQTEDMVTNDFRKCQIVLRYLRNYGDLPPTALAGGPYTASEGIPVLLDGSSTIDNGIYPGIVQYSWDTNNDGRFEVVTPSSKTLYAFPDDYNGKIVLSVKDKAGQTDTSQTWAHVFNVPPKADAGTDRTGNEGDLIEFSGMGTDVPLDTLTYIWSFGDNQIGTGQKVSHRYKDEGTYKVILIVTDKNGGSDRDSLRVTVLNVSPIAEAGGPYVFPISEPVQFVGTGTDPGILDVLSYAWDLNADGIFETFGKHASKKYSALGLYTVWFRIADGDGGVGIDTTSVVIVRDNPVVNSIPDQTIPEGKTFSPIPLDNYVKDPFYPDADLVWTFRGNKKLTAGIKNRIFTAAVPDSEYSGTETITFVAANPKNASDSTRVNLIVVSVNDPPKWIRPVSNYIFDEDSSLVIPLDSLRARVKDVDNLVGELVFSLNGNRNIQWNVNAKLDAIVLTAVHNWYGQEVLFFIVTDQGGLKALSQSQITVRSVPDPPSPFSLVSPLFFSAVNWPDTLKFKWHPTVDRDSTGGLIYYAWILVEEKKINEPIAKSIVFDTTYRYIPDKQLPKSTYFWWVIGYSLNGSPVKSENMGIVVIGKSDVADQSESTPSDFQLMQNYPNPFNPETRITYQLPKTCRVRLSIFNPLGQEVCVLEDREKNEGIYTVVWDGRNSFGQKLPSGLYLCRFQGGEGVYYRKMIIMQ